MPRLTINYTIIICSNKQDFSTAQDYANKYVANADHDPQNDYLVAQTCWAKKDYDCAINTAKNIIAKADGQTQPRVYRIIADSYVEKGIRQMPNNILMSFSQKRKMKILIRHDYILKGQIYGAVSGR